jgi:Ca2+-binding RTX toxin-like protein
MANTISGSAGDDHFVGLNDDTTFILSAGGNDTVFGAGGDDTFVMGGALTADDRLDGGTGHLELVTLDGDYGAGLVLQAATLTNIDRMDLAAGHDYAISGVVVGGLWINGSALGADDVLTVDTSQMSGRMSASGGDGADSLTGGGNAEYFSGGGGDDVIRAGGGDDHMNVDEGDNLAFGGDGADVFDAYSGADDLRGGAGDDVFTFNSVFNLATRVSGGAGHDTLFLREPDAGRSLTLTSDQVQSIETIEVGGGSLASLTLEDSVVAGGRTLAIRTTYGLGFDGSAETQGGFHIIGGAGFGASHHNAADNLTGGAGGDWMDGSYGADTLAGGGGDDTLGGGAGNDLLSGGAGDDLIDGGYPGADTLLGGDGADTLAGGSGADLIQGGAGADLLQADHYSADVLKFTSVGDSTVDDPDLVTGWSRNTIVDLHEIDADTGRDGNQQFHLAAAFTGHAREAVWSYDKALDRTTLLLDVNGDAHADMAIAFDGNARGYDNFVF